MTAAARTPPAFRKAHAEGSSMSALHEQAEDCRRCDLYKSATQVVFGEGRRQAPVMLVGEQPGDREDLAGKPFVGPAGRVLDECLDEAGIDRSACYVTNAVKHFKYERRGKRRLHARPNAGEVQRCAWWLGAELALLKPKMIVALGATALYALMGRSIGLMEERGHILKAANGTAVLVTIHPSYLLRIRDREDARTQRAAFVADLRKIAGFLEG